ncbi:hypothetical protein SAMN02745248_02768 [Hathewaya proteolytica DSM 3090]|uniref:Uncharacterized protein n=1 Tax=Hathewaya proteolytica DSM 3090 TaxID=1121331 RepID=A0A1M6TA32_9CLOT|nr:hypothetical protein [Hathewaya proteolytica]SHK53860.1 hypothetical protein SAMN02745248_02768 [Hathewaya proteolytica DSM 3090]
MGNLWVIISMLGGILGVSLLIMTLKSGATDIGKNKSVVIIIGMVVLIMLFSVQIFTYGQNITDIANEQKSWVKVLSDSAMKEYENKKLQSTFICVEGLTAIVVLFLSGQQILYVIKLKRQEQSILKSKSKWKLKELGSNLTYIDELLKKVQ